LTFVWWVDHGQGYSLLIGGEGGRFEREKLAFLFMTAHVLGQSDQMAQLAGGGKENDSLPCQRGKVKQRAFSKSIGVRVAG